MSSATAITTIATEQINETNSPDAQAMTTNPVAPNLTAANVNPMLTLSTLELLASKPTFEQFRTTMYKDYGVKCNVFGDLILLSTVHAARKDLTNSYAQECNGLIIERTTHRVVCYPPRCLKTNHNSGIVGQYLKDGLYKIYRAELGTLVSLYYYDGAWRLATSNATDQLQTRWSPTGLTYEEMINECLSAYVGPEATIAQFIAGLDPLHCYTIGFKHRDIHKFRADELKVWFVQKVCLDPQSPCYLFANDQCPMPGLPSQVVIEQECTVRDLYYQAKMAVRSITQRNNPDDETDFAPLYGFILRGSPTTCGEHSDLYVESSLSSTIRKIWYDNRIVQQRRATHLTHEDYVCTYQFLVRNTMFLELFPQYLERFTAMGNKLSMLAIMCSETNAVTDGDVVNNHQTLAALVEHCKEIAARNNPAPTTAADFHEFLHNPRLFDDLASFLNQ